MLRPVKPRQCKRANKIPTRPAFAFAVPRLPLPSVIYSAGATGVHLSESPELNRIVSDLNDDREITLADSSATLRLDRWLAALVQQGGSDLLLVPNAPPCLRFEGHVRQLDPARSAAQKSKPQFSPR